MSFADNFVPNISNMEAKVAAQVARKTEQMVAKKIPANDGVLFNNILQFANENTRIWVCSVIYNVVEAISLNQLRMNLVGDTLDYHIPPFQLIRYRLQKLRKTTFKQPLHGNDVSVLPLPAGKHIKEECRAAKRGEQINAPISNQDIKQASTK